MSHLSPPRAALPPFLQAWFGLDLILALLPPLHWWASGPAPILGVPRVLVYLFGTSLVIVASVVVAYQTTMDASDREAL